MENGLNVHQTSVPGKSTTLTVISDDGHQFTVTRERGKGMIEQSRYNVFILCEETCQRP